jgi:hypothetical protein
LLGANHIWRAIFTDGEASESDDNSSEFSTWERIAISLTDVLGSAAPTTFPKVVRNFLPATDDRPYDLLTVFGDRLYIYRRHQKNNRWILVSTLPTIDVALQAAPSAFPSPGRVPRAAQARGDYAVPLEPHSEPEVPYHG